MQVGEQSDFELAKIRIEYLEKELTEYVASAQRLSIEKAELRIENEKLRYALLNPCWAPIGSAPKDGRRVLLSTPSGRVADGYWSKQYNVWSWPYIVVQPTHWMPVIYPPKDMP